MVININIYLNKSIGLKFISNMMPLQLFSCSIHYLGSLQIYFSFNPSINDNIITRGGITLNKSVSTVLTHKNQNKVYFLISLFSSKINRGDPLRLIFMKNFIKWIVVITNQNRKRFIVNIAGEALPLLPVFLSSLCKLGI